ncbi:MAG: hypothetical protein GX596_08855 [Propionibacterium sp.]|nr:hypothetical protein [Propionibacterium sp.]
MLSPVQYGVGARFTLSVYADDYVDVILGALGAADASGLEIDTGDVSTFIGGDERRILTYLREVIAHAASTGKHLSAQILLSRGCPGELQCELPAGVAAIGGDAVELEPTGIRARAHWSLYPLLDGGHDAEHMDGIEQGIEFARNNGTYSGSDHFATRLDGDLAAVLATVASGWLLVGRDVQHVTTHVTISINSPTLIDD